MMAFPFRVIREIVLLHERTLDEQPHPLD